MSIKEKSANGAPRLLDLLAEEGGEVRLELMRVALNNCKLDHMQERMVETDLSELVEKIALATRTTDVAPNLTHYRLAQRFLMLFAATSMLIGQITTTLEETEDFLERRRQERLVDRVQDEFHRVTSEQMTALMQEETAEGVHVGSTAELGKKECCNKHLSRTGVSSPTKCAGCGQGWIVKDSKWEKK